MIRYFFETIQNFKLARDNKEAIGLIEEKLHAVGLSYEEFSGKYPSEFSGGNCRGFP
jgi:peptide/nickel transport system ATP-binding protein